MGTTSHKRKACHALIAALSNAGYETRFAGGCVRDRILGIEPDDFDLATTARPEQMTKVLTEAGYRVIPTGFEHGTVTAITKSGPVEITTLRIDLETDGRRATIGFVDDFRADANRRDFTMNAMFEDANGKIYDFFHGQEHLKTRAIHFVGDPGERIREDYLRILRLFRFVSRFGLLVSQETLRDVRKNRAGLQQVSQERITSEWRKILTGDKVDSVVDLMVTSGVFATIFPNCNTPSPETLKRVAAFRSHNRDELFLTRQAALLIGDHPKWERERAREILGAMRLSNSEARCLEFCMVTPSLIEGIPKCQAEAMAFLDHFESACPGVDFASAAPTLWDRTVAPTLALALPELLRIKRLKDHIRLAPLPLSARALMESLSLTPGPQLGALIAHLQWTYRNEIWRDSTEGLRVAAEWLAGDNQEKA